ncbi:MAG: DUF1003 domain-containing protein [Steroidobacteraceae bacterium]|nr:DUF1003 domain-containing protein [Deltaproteobacteria bacterium]
MNDQSGKSPDPQPDAKAAVQAELDRIARQKQEAELSEKLFHKKYEQLGKQEKHVAHHLAGRTHIARNVVRDASEQATFGQRLADKVASFGGSWTFISIFAAILVVWILLNSFILISIGSEAFDPYPYILLNLFLSMLAAIQAPIILMSQNRQAEKDRMSAEHDYEVNLKSELEIMVLHEKIDLLREKQWAELITIQQEQLRLLNRLNRDPSESR